jgi:two-component system sensor histidine kinase/response regulator
MAAPSVATTEHLPRARPATAARRVFVVDDDPVMLLSCRRILEKDGYEVETYSSGMEGIRRLEEVRPELLLVDLKMPELDGLQIIDRVRAIDSEIVIAVITGYATISTAIDAMKAGAYDFLPKPFTPDELRLVVNRGHERWRLAAESARLRAEKAEAERRFITFVSHQLKTPVVAAKQYVDVLLFTSQDEMTSHTRDWLTRAQARLDEMLGLIHDWLELARIDRGTLAEPGAACDAERAVTQVLAALRPQATAAGVTLHHEAAGPLNPVRGDPSSIGSVLSNLVSNGIKYNKVGGQVTVRTSREGAHARIDVVDTGIGVSPAALPKLFDEFYRERTDQTRDIPGSGLGLAICRRLVAALDGHIDVESRAGEGSTFTVRLPFAGPAPSIAPGDIA